MSGLDAKKIEATSRVRFILISPLILCVLQAAGLLVAWCQAVALYKKSKSSGGSGAPAS